MLRENVAQQKERIVEAASYARKGRPRAADHYVGGGLAPAWRHGCEILPVHAAQKRLAFAKLLLARQTTTTTTGARSFACVIEDLNLDVAYSVCVRVVPTDRASVLLAAQRR